MKSFRKKHLTNQKPRDRIAKLNSIARDLNDGSKEIQKNFKKGLTSRDERARIANVPPMRRVPCKLNNVTTHQPKRLTRMLRTDVSLSEVSLERR